MLKRIDPSDVMLGMYIHKLEGNWFSHPFWSARFLLTDPIKLEQLHASSVPGVIIDTDRGIDPDDWTDSDPYSGPRPVATPRSKVRSRRLPDPPATPVGHGAKSAPAQIMSAPPADVTRGFGKASAAAERGLKVVAHVFLEMRLGKAITPATVTPVIDAIIASVQSSPFAFNGLMRFRRETEAVYRHALATSALMIALARSMRMAPADVHDAGAAGLLLDVGVSRLPRDEMNPWDDPRQLPVEVWQSHVQLSHDFIIKSRLPESVARACLEHHERIDGHGWPRATPGSALSKLGRMAAICDAYDVLATGGEGRPALDPAEALAEMKRDRGAFDPDLLATFETTIGIWPTGSVVEMRSGRLALVIDQNRDAPDRPTIAAFYDPAARQRIDDVFINLQSCYGADAIVGPGLIAALPPLCQANASAALAATLDRLTPTKRTGANAPIPARGAAA
jgi:HD-GYP domain-containing protein (c-di-GMP phosphodiesterase class II)